MGPRIECDLGALPLLPRALPRRRRAQAKRQIQDGLLAATFFDVEPGVISGRPMPATGSDGNVALEHTWQLPG